MTRPRATPRPRYSAISPADCSASAAPASRAHARDHALRRQPLRVREQLRAVHRAQHGAVRHRQRRGELVLENAPPHGVRARLERHPQRAAPASGCARPRWWRESPWDDARNRPPRSRRAASPRTCMRRATPRNVRSASSMDSRATPRPSAMAMAASAFNTLCRPAMGSRMRARSSPWRATRKCVAPSLNSMSPAIQILSRAESVGLHRAKRLGHHAAHRGALAPADDATAPRHQIHQPPELQFDGGEVGVNIGVVEFERSDDQVVGAVVQKLRALVEKCRIVLVAFDE